MSPISFLWFLLSGFLFWNFVYHFRILNFIIEIPFFYFTKIIVPEPMSFLINSDPFFTNKSDFISDDIKRKN